MKNKYFALGMVTAFILIVAISFCVMSRVFVKAEASEEFQIIKIEVPKEEVELVEDVRYLPEKENKITEVTEKIPKFYFDDGVIFEEVKILKIKATAYCHCAKCCDKTPDHDAYGITKSGLDLLAPGANIRIVAADTSILPLGTKIYIEVPEKSQDMYVTKDYGIATVEDTGGAIKGNRIDVYFPTHEEALEWGIRDVEVHVLIPVS